jgi:hypothetical protein
MAADMEDLNAWILANGRQFQGRRFAGRVMEADRAYFERYFKLLIELEIIDLDEDGQPVWTPAAADAFHKVCSQSWC